MVEPAKIPNHMHDLVAKVLAFSSSQLARHAVFYPFAAVCEKGKFDCVMTDHAPSVTDASDMIEILQWRLIDIAYAKPLQTALAYSAILAEKNQIPCDAVAIELSDEKDSNYFLVFPYTVTNGEVIFAEPLTETSN
ncbi:hypothetical protein DRW07_00320 [Alteromonas sediminis]|uniref:Uncharacterized protein n=1 Tax=Alteromonas sediminis TaxID=2259342 RepID=A0A3N5Y2G2_9ALTE|nr:hypothetical protein [Alteromonas sediminis]RPJ67892.1 hypothetical protein DRW07_00320 [Alteromonas sediminis]